MKNYNENARTLAREAAFQVLFAWMVSQNNPKPLLGKTIDSPIYSGIDAEYAGVLVDWVVLNREKMIAQLQPCLHARKFYDLTLVEQVVLLLGAVELTFSQDIAYQIVLDEATGLTKRFGAQDGYKIVNAVLDRFSQNMRAPKQTSDDESTAS